MVLTLCFIEKICSFELFSATNMTCYGKAVHQSNQNNIFCKDDSKNSKKLVVFGFLRRMTSVNIKL